MLEIALKENRDDDAAFFADVYKSVSKQFNIPKWICYQAHLQLAIEKQDKEVCLSILKKMLPAMKEEWHPKQFRLYQNTNDNNTSFLSSKLLDVIRDDFMNKEEFAFIRGNAEFDKLIAKITE